MDPTEDPLWFAQQLVDTLRREVGLREAELAMLISHKATLLRAFSTPTFPPGYTPSGTLYVEPHKQLQDRSNTKKGSRPDAPGLSGKSDRGKRAHRPAVMVKHDTPPCRSSSPAVLETSDDSLGTPATSKGQGRDCILRAEPAETVISDAGLRHVAVQSSSLGGSSESSEGKTKPSPVTRGMRTRSKFPVVNWTEQIRERTITSLNGDTSSDSEDSICSEAPADKERSNSLQPTNTRKIPKSAIRPAKAATQVSNLSSDAPPEDLFDWEVLGFSGPWSTGQSSSLLTESSQSQQPKQQCLLPCKFETIDKYRSSFEGLIFEECKAHLNSSWEMLGTPVVGISHGSPELQGVSKDIERTSLWQFRPMYPSADDPFKYIEAEQIRTKGCIDGLSIRLDPSELVLLTYNDRKFLAIVTITNYNGVLLRTRVELPASGGQCNLLRLANMVTLKRQYIALLKVSEIWDPLQQQLLDPQKNSNNVISPPSDNCLDDDVELTSGLNTVLTWRKKKIFNNKQLVTIEALLELRQGFLLVQGMVSAMQIEEPGARILVCASSNAAIDEIVSRLMYHMLDIAGNSYMPERGTLIRLGVQTSIQTACLPISLDNIWKDFIASKSSNTKREILAGASIVCCTISGSGNQIFDEVKQKFDLLIIDEAAQALESEVLIALHRVKGRCVMVGDPCQLPAVVLQRPGKTYGRSLFERMQETGQPIFLMTTQYRMHPHISKFPSAQFYGGRLKDSPQSRSMLPIFRENAQNLGIDTCGYNFKLGAFFFLDVTWGMEQGELIGHSIANINEADVVATVVWGVVRSLRDGIEPNIGVITPYLAQRSVIMENLQQYGLDESVCEVNTVDGFQGREKDIIILSCVRAQSEYGLGFVSDVRRMNVALTRARHSLIIVGHAETLRHQSPVWNSLIEDASARGLYQLLYQKPKKRKMGVRQKNADDQRANAGAGTRQHANQRRFEQGATASPTGIGQQQSHTKGGQGNNIPTGHTRVGHGIKTPSGTGKRPNQTRVEHGSIAAIGSGQYPNQTKFENGPTAAIGNGPLLKQTRLEHGATAALGPGQCGTQTRFQYGATGAIRTGQRPNQTRFEDGATAAIGTGQHHLRFEEDADEAASPVHPPNFSNIKQIQDVHYGKAVSFSKQSSGDIRRKEGGQKRKADWDGTGYSSQNLWKEVKLEGEDHSTKIKGCLPVPAVGRMRGQIDSSRSGSHLHHSQSLGAITVKGVTRQEYSPYGHGQAVQMSEWPVDARNCFGRDGNTAVEFGEERNSANFRNPRGRGYRGSGKSNHQLNQVDFCKREQKPVRERWEDSPASWQASRQTIRKGKKQKGYQTGSLIIALQPEKSTVCPYSFTCSVKSTLPDGHHNNTCAL